MHFATLILIFGVVTLSISASTIPTRQSSLQITNAMDEVGVELENITGILGRMLNATAVCDVNNFKNMALLGASATTDLITQNQFLISTISGDPQLGQIKDQLTAQTVDLADFNLIVTQGATSFGLAKIIAERWCVGDIA